MRILNPEEKPSRRGPSGWFGGEVWLDEMVTNDAPSRLKVVRVSFSPSARTAWHTHPLGQTLHVVAGVGLIQVQGQAARTLRPGDTVSILPGEIHWHGAAPEHTFIHLAMQEADGDGIDVVWLEHVTDQEYSAR